jgi:hypothetical protein
MEEGKQEVEAGPQTVETQASTIPITVEDEQPTPEYVPDSPS